MVRRVESSTGAILDSAAAVHVAFKATKVNTLASESGLATLQARRRRRLFECSRTPKGQSHPSCQEFAFFVHRKSSVSSSTVRAF